MSTYSTFLASFLLSISLYGQQDQVQDTLLIHTFEGLLDPADSMLTAPTGEDIFWINYDQDGKEGRCVNPGPTPSGWFWESDLGFVDPNMADNYAFTSCSYLASDYPQNYNWLITSPVYIPDNSYWLCWRSLSYYGPDFMDGYRVLVSTTTNFPEAFTDTLFSAAQTEKRFVVGSLNTNDYAFSDGYLHANGYTDEDYFFVDYENNKPFYHGKLEPHSVNLSAYSGKTIYIAYLHDSFDDYQIQVDDILVTNTTVGVSTPSDLLFFNIMPNPVSDNAFINWRTKNPQAVRLNVMDQSGKCVFEKQFDARVDGQYHLDAQSFEAGIYYCTMQTASGLITRKLVKL